jgi:sugar O-acyltransferase (sialic acid O-acetyltransferase NeuD family)
MIQRIVIIGTGGLAYDILDIVEACNRISRQWEIVGFLDDGRPSGSLYHGYQILGRIDEAARQKDCRFILAVGSDKSYVDRQDLIRRTGLVRDDFATLIHPNASVSRLATIGNGVYVSHGVAISASVIIGDHVSLSPGCLVGHDSLVGDYTVAAPGACISGFVDVAPSCYIGARAVIRQKIRIGTKALVGMGAAVIRDVPPMLTVVGNPARPLVQRNIDLGRPKLPRIDVIVPCYNYAHYLKACVESVLNQEGVDPRVLILDDASPDNTAEVGMELARRDTRVEFRRHVVNCGHIPTFNEGLQWAGGEFLLLLSADDLLLPGALQRATDIFRKHPKVTLVHGNAIMSDEIANFKQPIITDPSYKLMTGQAFLEASCRDGKNHVFTPTAIVRTEMQKALGGYRRELLHTGDMEMWLRHAVQGDVAEVAAHQALYRVHGKNMSAQYNDLNEIQQHWFALAAIFREHWEKIVDAPRLRAQIIEMFGKEIFYMGNTFFDAGNVEGCQRCLDVALQINPAIASSPAYRRLELKRRLGPKVWSMLRSMVRIFTRPEPVSL